MLCHQDLTNRARILQDPVRFVSPLTAHTILGVDMSGQRILLNVEIPPIATGFA